MRKNRCCGCGLALGSKRLSAAKHLVEHDAETKDVAARINLVAAHLLWRHIRDGANDCSGLTKQGFGLRLTLNCLA